jgi:DNA modification methylase
MGEEKWDLLFTSPPYAGGDNAGYKPDYYAKTKRFYHHDKDAMTRDEWIAFCNLWMSEAASCKASDDCPAVVNVMYTANNRDGYGVVMFAGSHPFKVRETICWDKHAGFPSATKGILSRNWELVFVLSVAEKYRTTQGESEVRFAKWETQRPEQTDTIKATFPIELPAQAINDFGGDTIYEPFTGSGTTMVACENLKRKCRGIEISPDYTAVCLERMATAFPQLKAERIK